MYLYAYKCVCYVCLPVSLDLYLLKITLKFLCICFWLDWVCIASKAFLSLWRAGLLCCCSARASHGFSCCRTRALGCTGFSSYSSWALEHRLSSCGTQAQLLLGMWDLPGSGIEPMSPVLAGGFFTTEPPRKPLDLYLCVPAYVYVSVSVPACISM